MCPRKSIKYKKYIKNIQLNTNIDNIKWKAKRSKKR